MKSLDQLKSRELDELFNAILSLESIDECYNFFDDVCTINELMAIAQRFDVARLLLEGKNYVAISKESGASSATISRVNRCLSFGNGGYKMALSRLKEKK